MNRALWLTGAGAFLGAMCGTLASGAATGVDLMGAIKIDFHVQNSSEMPEPEDRFAADVFLEASTGESVSGATLSRPSGPVIHLERDEPGSAQWNGGEEFTERGARDAAFPDGAYTFNVATAGHGNQQVTLNLVGNVFPAAPRVSNYSQAQAIDAEKAFILSWDPFMGAGAEDFIILGIEDESADDEIFHSGFLPATTTSIELPAGLFQPDHAYGVYIMFANVTDSDEVTFTGGRALAGYFSETWLEIRTQGAPGTGVEFFGVMKLNHFIQMNEQAPQRSNDEEAFGGEIFLEAVDANTVLAAAVSAPSGTTYSLEREDSSDDDWYFEVRSGEQAERDQAFPDGTYEFRVETVDGERFVPLHLVGDAYSAAPRISNHGALQAIDSAAPFTLAWDAFSGADADDFVVLGIEDPMNGYETVFESDFLAPGSTSLEIPAGLLQPGRIYLTWIAFVNVVDKNETAFAGATGLAGYLSETKTYIRTAANPGPGAGVDAFGILKMAFYWQNSVSAPELDTEDDPFEVFAFVEPADASALAGVAVITPEGVIHHMNRKSPDSGWEGSESYASQAALDEAFPNGIHTFNIVGAEEGKYVSLNLTGNAYPSPVRINNFEAAQAIDAGQSFVLSWDLPGGIGAEDIVVVGIEDSLSGEKAFDSGFLPGNTHSVELPAGALQPDRDYEVWISLVKVVDTNIQIFPDARGIAGYVAETGLQIRTAKAGLTFADWAEQLPFGERGELDDPGERGIVNLLRYAFGMNAAEPERGNLPQAGTALWNGDPGADHLSLTFTRRKETSDIDYVVEVSTDLSAPWTPLEGNPLLLTILEDDGNGETETVTVIDPESIDAHGRRFLRVRVVR